MARALGMSPDDVRNHATAINGHLAALDALARQVNQARQASHSPQSYGIESGAKIISPSSQGSVQTAYNELVGAIASARSLVGRLNAQAAEQESASGQTGSAAGPIGFGGGGGDGKGKSTSSSKDSASFGFVAASSSKSDLDVTIEDKNGKKNILDELDDPSKKDKDPGTISAEIKDEYKFGVGGTISHEQKDDAAGTSSSSTVTGFAGAVLTDGVKTEISPDEVKTTASVGAALTASVAAAGKFSNGVFDGSGSAEADATLEAKASASGTVEDDGTLKGTLTAEAGASVNAQAAGEIALGVASVGGTVAATAGASAKATATGTIGPNGASVKAGVEAMAGASASAKADVEAMGVKGEVTGTVYAGAGIKANVGVDATLEKVDVHCDLGVALGVGAGVSFDISFSPEEAAKDVLSLFGW